MFFTSVYDRNGKESFDSKLIAYRKTNSFMFYPELLSILGTDLISRNSEYLKYFALLKTFRLFRIRDLIRNSTFHIHIKMIMNLAKLCFYLLFYLWGLGCTFWMAVSYNAPKQYHFIASENAYQAIDGEYYEENGEKYIASSDGSSMIKWGKPITFGEAFGRYIPEYKRDLPAYWYTPASMVDYSS